MPDSDITSEVILPKKPEEVITPQLTQAAEDYSRLRRAYETLEEDTKHRLSILRKGMELIEEEQRVALEYVRDQATEKAKLKYPAGTFSLSRTGRITLTDRKALVDAIVRGDVSPAIFGNDITHKVVNEYIDRRREETGYANLTPEQKAVCDINQYTPPGISLAPYERVAFRRAPASRLPE